MFTQNNGAKVGSWMSTVIHCSENLELSFWLFCFAIVLCERCVFLTAAGKPEEKIRFLGDIDPEISNYYSPRNKLDKLGGKLVR